VRQAFALRASGAGLTSIADFLNSGGVLTSRGNSWGTTSVAGMLTNRTYLGEIRCGEHVNPTAHEPLVDAAVFHAAAKPKGSFRQPRSDASHFYLLARIARCAACGYTLRGSTDGREYRPLYRCNRRHGGGVCPRPARALAEPLEAAVSAAYLADDRVLAVPVEKPDLAPLEEAEAVTRRRLEQVLSPEGQDALGEAWAATAKARRVEHEKAAAALGEARAINGTAEVERLVELKRAWQDEAGLAALAEGGTEPVYFLSDELKRQLIGRRFGVIAVEKTGRGKWEWYEPEAGDLPAPGEWTPELRPLRRPDGGEGK
jgi:hypothetical protein